MANTVTVVRPNGDVTVGAHWTTGSASHNAAQSDNSDATYSAHDNTGNTTEQLILDFGTVSIPNLAQIRSITQRIRWSAVTIAAGAYSVGKNCWTRVGGVDRFEQILSVVNDASIRTTSGSAQTTNPSGNPWTQADIDGLQLKLTEAAVDTPDCRIYEAYFDVAYNQAPVVSAITPSGVVTTTNTPQVGWTYTDPENDAQERYWVKIFDAATLAAGGFNPETSTPVATSGEVFWSLQYWNCNVPLSSGVTYTAYVKASDNGSNGRYSAWAAGSTFSIATAAGLLFDPPAVPTVVSATPDPVLNRVALALRGGDNNLTRNQSSLESSIAGWSAMTNVAAGYPQRQTTAGGFAHGTAGGIVRSAAAGTMTIRSTSAVTLAALQLQATQVVPGQVRTSLGSLKALSVTGRTATLTVTYYDATAAVVGSATTGAAVTVLTAAFTQASVQATVPTNGLYEVLALNILGAAGANEDIYFDQMSSAPGTSTVWTRGGFAQNQGALADTFTRADSASTLGSSEGAATPAWTALSGTWGISSNKAYLASTTTGAFAVVASPALTDGVLTCDVTLSATTNRANAGLVLRCADVNNSLYVTLWKVGTGTSDQVTITKVVGGAISGLASYPSAGLVNGATYGVKIEFFGGLIRVWLDRKDGKGYTKVLEWQLVAADIATFAGAANTGYGLRVDNQAGNDDGGSRFDNFTVGIPVSQLLLAERSVDGGVTWAGVRSAYRVAPTQPGQQGTFYDYEAPRGQAVRYRARAQAAESDQTFLGGYSASLAMSPNLASDANAWLKSPSNPALNIAVNLVKDSVGSTSDEHVAVYQPLGRPDPVIMGDTIRLEAFPGFEFLCLNDAQWLALEALRAKQEALLLQTCYGDTVLEQFWVRLGPTRAVVRLTMSTAPGQLRRVKVPAHQVAVPAVV